MKNDFKSTDTYKGFSVKQLQDKFVVDTVKGVILSRKGNRQLTTKNSKGHLVVGVRDAKGGNVTLLQRWILFFIHHGYVPVWPDVVACKDGNEENLTVTNLVVVDSKGLIRRRVDHTVTKIDDRIYYEEQTGNYIVRRSKTQSIYTTPVLDEAVFIRNEWKSDKTVCRPDRFQWERYKNLGLSGYSEDNLDKTCIWQLYVGDFDKSAI